MKNKYNYRNILLFSGVVFLMTVLITVFAWQKIPNDAQIPIHWNVKGEVDNYGSKTFGLLIGPGMVFILTLLLTFIPRMEPRIENLQQSQKAYKVVWVFILLLMAALHLMTTLFALGKPVDITMSMAFVIGALFIAIGNYMGKIRSNFMFGIRTPWTLTSDIAWNKTHRLGGWSF